MKALALTAAALIFFLAATANSGGYRYGVSDQAFYATAVIKDLHPQLYPKDSRLLDVESHLMWADEIVAGVIRGTGASAPAVYLGLYAAGLLLLFAGAIAFARRAGFSWWASAALLALLTFRHRISKTGANSLEGYMHPRMIAFAFGVLALSAVVRRRHVEAAVWTLVIACWHPTTAVWFGVPVFVAACVDQPEWRRALLAVLGVAALAGTWMVLSGPLAGRLTIMDPEWLGVLAEKDYLFPHEWPAYAWVANLAYPVVIVAIHRRRRALARTVEGETGLVAGLVSIALLFLVALPLTMFRVALAVQLQVTRVFWVLDFATAAYLAWWLLDDLASRRKAARIGVLTVFVAASLGRGVFLLSQDRHLFSPTLGASQWVDAMTWLRRQPQPWHVLADPGHAWKYGVSVRLAGEKDTLVESGKDTALSIYDRDLAMRVKDRLEALNGFEQMAAPDLRSLAVRYDLDVAVIDTKQPVDLPVLYRNDTFAVYQLR